MNNGNPAAIAHEPQAARDARQDRNKYFMNIAMAVRLRANCKGNVPSGLGRVLQATQDLRPGLSSFRP
ncbi:MAG TPA: hypothetical protein VN682_02020 [Terriglobales bacterium]|jgi:hypothetical protein|nr:hypothetical protein [Terriglobales bacterium]